MLRRLRRRYDWWRFDHLRAGPKILRAFGRVYRHPFFIEIGANDGLRVDYLRENILSGGWSGILVEPVPYVFERLRLNYSSAPQVILENSAIADRDGVLPFYQVTQPDEQELGRLPGWYDGIGSFLPDVVKGHVDFIPDIEERIVRTDVPCLTLESLCRKHNVERFDLLLLDIEGYDYELIRHIDFNVRHPRLLVYEHYHLAPDERRQCRALIERFGYETMEEWFDTWCIDPRPDDHLTRTWRRVRALIPGVSVHDAGERTHLLNART